MKTAEEMIKEQKYDVICVSPETSVREALKIMTGKKIGAILIRDKGEIVGIWTERDLMKNVLEDGFDLDKSMLKSYMTTNLQYADHDATIIQLQDKYLGLRIRHLLVKKEDKFIGMLSSGDVTRHGLKEKSDELKKLNKIVSWEYYENWRW